MNKILIVEDEPAVSNLIRISLTNAGYSCHCISDGAAAADILEENSYDLILLDVMLPYVDGFELMDYIKPLNIPVIFLTAKDSVHDRVKGLRMGAEDYIIKPFEVIELLARVDVVLRRYNKTSTLIHMGGLVIDTKSMKVSRDEHHIHLTHKEYELLLLFVNNPNTALYHETIYRQVWGGDLEFGSKTVALHIQRLRKKIGWEHCLQAVNKVGYRLEIS